MVYGHIQGLEKACSRIVIGCARLQGKTDAEIAELFDAAQAQGVNTLDTARIYPDSEEALGRWLKSGVRREDWVILTKGCHPDPASMETPRINRRELQSDLEQSLAALGTDYADIYLLHRDDVAMPAGEIVELLNEQHRAGRIRAFGGSNWTAARLAEANDYAAAHGLVPFTASSPYFGLAEMNPAVSGLPMLQISIAGPAEQAQRDWYSQNQMPIFAYSSLACGLFGGRIPSERADELRESLGPFVGYAYWSDDNLERLRRAETLSAQKGFSVAQVALGWLLAQSPLVYALVSVSSARRLADNCAALDIPLGPEELAWLNLQ